MHGGGGEDIAVVCRGQPFVGENKSLALFANISNKHQTKTLSVTHL
jgi:hypothetical protein